MSKWRIWYAYGPMLSPPVEKGWVPIDVEEDEFYKAWDEFMRKIRPSAPTMIKEES